MTISSPFDKSPSFIKSLNTSFYRSSDNQPLSVGLEVFVLIDEPENISIDKFKIISLLDNNTIEIEKPIPNGITSRKVRSNSVCVDIQSVLMKLLAHYKHLRDVTISNKIGFLTETIKAYNPTFNLSDIKTGNENTIETI